jgi:hypothetical protein
MKVAVICQLDNLKSRTGRLTDLVVVKLRMGLNDGSMEVLAIQDPGVGGSGNLIGLSAGSAGWTSCDTGTGSRGMSLSRKCDGLTLQLRSAGLTLDLRSDVLRNLAHGGKLDTTLLE